MVSIEKAQDVKAGDVLLTLEAMKIWTALYAPRDGMDSKDLLIELR
jgi:biotin carboxyl carrier protein